MAAGESLDRLGIFRLGASMYDIKRDLGRRVVVLPPKRSTEKRRKGRGR